LCNRCNWKSFATILLISFAISISRLYLGVSWLSDVLGGFFIGTGLVVLSGIAWLKNPAEKIPEILLGITVVLVVIVAGGWRIAGHHEKDLAFYAPRHHIKTVKSAVWADGGWKKIPAWKFDIEGERKQPLTLQFAGSLHDFAQHLQTAGWHSPLPTNLKNFLGIFSPHVSIDQFPVLPHLHSGLFDSLRLVYHKSGSSTRWVLRLWPSDFRIRTAKGVSRPLFTGTIEEQRFRHLTGLITAAMDTGNYDDPAARVKAILKI